MNYFEQSLILPFGCVLISAFASAVGTPVGITSSSLGLKICVIAAGIKKYKSIIKKYKKTVILAKSKLNTMEGLISKGLIDSHSSHDEFISIY